MIIFGQLFLTFFKIGLFNFGGGYAMVSFIQNEVVYKNNWISISQFTDIVALSQVTPGPLGINMATYTGYVVTSSIYGAIGATFAVCLPSFILMILISKFFLKYHQNNSVKNLFKGLRPAVVGLIAAAALVLCNKENIIDYKSVLLLVGAFFAVWKYKVGPIVILLVSGLLGLILY